MKRSLVVFYSRSGRTCEVARRLAEALGADFEEITEARGRGGILGYARCIVEVLRGRRPRIEPTHHHPRGYAQVVVGTPVWAGHMASPVRSYLALHAADIKHPGFFCTYGGSGADRTLAEMAELIGHAPVATMAITDREIDARDEAKLANFVHSLHAGSA
jgi:flavodoxin